MTASVHNSSELERLLNASVDGELSDSDESALQALLRDDVAAAASLPAVHAVACGAALGPRSRWRRCL